MCARACDKGSREHCCCGGVHESLDCAWAGMQCHGMLPCTAAGLPAWKGLMHKTRGALRLR